MGHTRFVPCLRNVRYVQPVSSNLLTLPVTLRSEFIHRLFFLVLFTMEPIQTTTTRVVISIIANSVRVLGGMLLDLVFYSVYSFKKNGSAMYWGSPVGGRSVCVSPQGMHTREGLRKRDEPFLSLFVVSTCADVNSFSYLFGFFPMCGRAVFFGNPPPFTS